MVEMHIPKPGTPRHMVPAHHPLDRESGRKDKGENFFIFTSLEVTFSRSLLVMMLRSLALMSRSVRSLSVGLGRNRNRRGSFQAGSTCTALRSEGKGLC